MTTKQAKPATPRFVEVYLTEWREVNIKVQRLEAEREQLAAALRDAAEQLRGDIRLAAKESEKRARALLARIGE